MLGLKACAATTAWQDLHLNWQRKGAAIIHHFGWVGMGAHTCNPSTLEAEAGGLKWEVHLGYTVR